MDTKKEIINEIINLLSVAEKASKEISLDLNVRFLTEKESKAIQEMHQAYEKIRVLEGELRKRGEH